MHIDTTVLKTGRNLWEPIEVGKSVKPNGNLSHSNTYLGSVSSISNYELGMDLGVEC